MELKQSPRTSSPLDLVDLCILSRVEVPYLSLYFPLFYHLITSNDDPDSHRKHSLYLHNYNASLKEKIVLIGAIVIPRISVTNENYAEVRDKYFVTRQPVVLTNFVGDWYLLALLET